MTFENPTAGTVPPVVKPDPIVPPEDLASLRHEEVRRLLQWIMWLQVAILVGIVIVFLQFGGLADQVAERVPIGSDNTGDIYQVQSSVDDLTLKVNALMDKAIEIQGVVDTLPAPR